MMSPIRELLFPPFRLDIIDERLWRGVEAIPLRRKTFIVLRYLAEHAAQLVTKEVLLDAVWPDVVVSEGALTECVRELRKALGDDSRSPRFIETVHGRGYRFIAPVATAPLVISSQFSVLSKNETMTTSSQLTTNNWQLTTRLVGRDTELAQLHHWLQKAQGGERQIVFVSGEPGIGKTTLVDTFLAELGARNWGLGTGLPSSQASSPKSQVPVLIARGQCIEHYSTSEAYLPVLEAVEHLCHGPEGERVIALLRQYAPLWLAQLPSVLDAAEREALQRQVLGATQERMLREMAQALEELTAVQPLLLWLEDLHGSDYATLDLLAFLARRREPARLLVIGTYRPLAVRGGEHPLAAIQHELQVRAQCQELALEPLVEEAVAEYLETRVAVGAHVPLREMARAIHQRTEGNPLFLVSLVETILRQEDLRADSEAVSRAVPANIRQFIEQQIEQLKPEEREVLEAASVAGMECSAAAIAAGLGEQVEEVEQRCTTLARWGHFIREDGVEEWLDGTVATGYRFVHALYQEVLYEGITAARRVSFHRRIGERIAHGYGRQASEIAAELAMHFERGRDYERTVCYLHTAGETALQRHAYHEAVTFLNKGIALLRTLAETPEHRQHELRLHMALGPALSISQGWGDPQVGRLYTRARELCQQVGDAPLLIPALQGLWMFSFTRAEHKDAHELGKQLLRLAPHARDPALLVAAHCTLGTTLLFLGELAAAHVHAEQGIAHYDLQQHHALALLYAEDPGITCLIVSAWILWFRGYPAQALARAEETLTVARTLAHPFHVVAALFTCALVSQYCHRPGLEAQWTDEAVALSSTQGFPFWLTISLVLRGTLLAHRGQSEEGIEQMKQGLAAFRATGAEILRPHFLALLAEAYGQNGQIEEGLTALTEALAAVEKTGERYYEAELWRLKGDLLLRRDERVKGRKGEKITSSPPHSVTLSSPEACFHKAIEIARRQGAKSLELRAVMSLSRLWQQQGKKRQARKLLAEVYGWFTEGFDTADLQEARAFLAALV
jgi:DNA-binding winged helix-turn-helix (wHTH) protein/predicted ATPase